MIGKNELAAKIAEKTGISKVKAGEAIDTFLAAISDTMKNGDTVQLKGFGTFSASLRAARTGRNPATGAELAIAACKVPKFSAGKTLKALLK